ncbi:hypothetical protein Acr_25g0011340 [Actinidia rufa]|uniref:Uncharacterized protein n=1 Tax=Actinidia rufa TaxID=165716 RepID=A0A7J0H126_9ERIC|nr:hypothetical protein Acr_25g0011340 [Actinidia rufa]
MEDYEENVHNEHGCGCLWKLWFVRRNNNSSQWILQQQEGEIKETWLENKAKKVKEISEVLAGPKWKNFIRRRESDAPRADFAARFAPPGRTNG